MHFTKGKEILGTVRLSVCEGEEKRSEIDAGWSGEHVFLITKFPSRRFPGFSQAIASVKRNGVLRYEILITLRERPIQWAYWLPNMMLALEKKKPPQGSKPGYVSPARLEQ